MVLQREKDTGKRWETLPYFYRQRNSWRKSCFRRFTLSVWYICLITVERQGFLPALPHHHEDYYQSPWTGAASKVLLLGDSPKCFRGRAFWEVLRSLADDFGRGCRSPVSSQAPFLGDDVSFLFTQSLLWKLPLGSHQRPNQWGPIQSWLWMSRIVS